jgi:hypothetical protein
VPDILQSKTALPTGGGNDVRSARKTWWSACDTPRSGALSTTSTAREAAPPPDDAAGGVKRLALAGVPGARLACPSRTTTDVTPSSPLGVGSQRSRHPPYLGGAMLVAPATGVAAAVGPRLPGLAHHGDGSPAMCRRRGHGLPGARVLATCMRGVAHKRRG